MLEHTPCCLISSDCLGLNYSELCNMDTEGILGTCFPRWEDHWNACVERSGKYSEDKFHSRPEEGTPVR